MKRLLMCDWVLCISKTSVGPTVVIKPKYISKSSIQPNGISLFYDMSGPVAKPQSLHAGTD